MYLCVIPYNAHQPVLLRPASCTCCWTHTMPRTGKEGRHYDAMYLKI